MGAKHPKPAISFKIIVKTGDVFLAGTDANVYIRLHDDASHESERIQLDHTFRNDLERGSLDQFKVRQNKVPTFAREACIDHIEVWRDDVGLGSGWLVDTITVVNVHTGVSFVFPIFRWLKEDYHYRVKHLNTSLPQFDPFPDQRREELEERIKEYEFDQKIPQGPVQVKEVPEAENFSFSYKWDIVSLKMKLIAQSTIKKLMSSGEFDSLQDMANVYDNVFPPPKDFDGWKSDVYFGYQRIASHNPILITLAKEIPEKFPVTDDELANLLEGLTLNEALRDNRLFLCDYQIMEGIPTKEGFVICHPMGLFFENMYNELVPVAIQLFQTPGLDNPIFTPEDPELLWCLVKMWFNNADAAYHQAIAHLGHTHLLMEGITVASHRTMSMSHPIFKILAPHFLYVIAINARALKLLLPENSWIDNNMNAAAEGTIELSRRGLKEWRMDVNGSLPADLTNRGLADTKVLRFYYYREDGIEVYRAIHKYVTSYVNHYYNSSELLTDDTELQAWAKELVTEREDHGVGLKGVPGNGQLTSVDQLITIISSIIFTCSVTHAAANFPQYNQYCYPPNYPAMLRGKPPSSKTLTVTEQDLVKALPNRPTTLDIMVVTQILSTKDTQSLGDFEVQYVYDPDVLPVIDQFRADLKEISENVKRRNSARKYVYEHLDPDFIPNSISI